MTPARWALLIGDGNILRLVVHEEDEAFLRKSINESERFFSEIADSKFSR
mgnify:CR=1 FL=1